MTSFAEPFLCLYCERFAGTLNFGGGSDLLLACTAYPDGIPAAILSNRADHREPYDGDRGIRFLAEPSTVDAVDAIRWRN